MCVCGGGGGGMRGVGQVQFDPYKNRGGGGLIKFYSGCEGGGTTSLEVAMLNRG